MPELFSRQKIKEATSLPDSGKLNEISSHQLLQTEDKKQIASFDEVIALGERFLANDYNTVLSSDKPLPQDLLMRLFVRKNPAFQVKLVLGPSAEDQFPATAQVVKLSNGLLSLKLQVVPIHFAALNKAAFEKKSDSSLALAAAAAVAPQFLLSLETGVSAEHCETEAETISQIAPDHGTPLVTVFDVFEGNLHTLDQITHLTQNKNITLQQAGHLHERTANEANKISSTAAHSKISAGVEVMTVFYHELPALTKAGRYALFIQTRKDEMGQPQIVSILEGLGQFLVDKEALALMSAALGFTAQVTGNEAREKRIEKILTPQNSQIPLRELLR